MKALTKGFVSWKRAALTKDARGLSAMVRGARRASTPLMQCSTSYANSTAPSAGKRPTPHVSADSTRS
jgi:hypothetical protein